MFFKNVLHILDSNVVIIWVECAYCKHFCFTILVTKHKREMQDKGTYISYPVSLNNKWAMVKSCQWLT